MAVRNHPANTSHLGGSSSKSNCKRDEILSIVLAWMQVGRAAAAALCPQECASKQLSALLWCHLGDTGHSPLVGPMERHGPEPVTTGLLSGKRTLLEGSLSLCLALPAPLLDSAMAREPLLPG